MTGVFLDHSHGVTGVSHLRKQDELSAGLFCPPGKIPNFGKIYLRVAKRTGDLGNGDFHLRTSNCLLNARHVDRSRDIPFDEPRAFPPGFLDSDWLRSE
jgi:hypothetical protein